MCNKIGSSALGGYCRKCNDKKVVIAHRPKHIDQDFTGAFPSDLRNFNPESFGLDQDKFPMED